ncbi:MAG: recombinase family protein [Chryseobacterium sp.]|nr:MAG: recombinase family protein [Chryseobacterium sp.]
MQTAILYIRVSTDEQAKKGYSLGHQEEVLRHYCLVKDIDILKIISEDYSAKNFKRPAWSSLLANCKYSKAKRPDYILFTIWNRFSRNITEAYLMIKKLQDMDITPQAIEQPLDMSVPENKIVLANYLAMAEVENERRSLSVKATMHSAKMQGRWMGSAPIGYCNKTSVTGKKYIAPHEPEASYVKAVFELVAQGLFSIRQAYHISRANGLICSLNNFWALLRNPVYCGKIAIKHKDIPSLTVDGQHEKIISPALFEQVQRMLNKRKVKPVHKSREDLHQVFPFRGFLYCPNCGRKLTGSGSKGRSSRYFYYHCSSQCGFRVRASEVHRIFHETIQAFHPHDSYIQLFTDILEKNSKKIATLESVNQRRIIQKIEDIQDHIGSARQLLLSKDIDAQEYFKIKSDYEARIEILKNKMNDATTSLIKYKTMIDLMTPLFSKPELLFDKCNINEKQKLIMLFYGQKIVWKDSCFVTSLNEKAKMIYNYEIEQGRIDEINRQQSLIENNIIAKLETSSTDCKKIFDIEYKRGHALTSAQTQEIANFLYDLARIIIGLFIPQWRYTLSG